MGLPNRLAHPADLLAALSTPGLASFVHVTVLLRRLPQLVDVGLGGVSLLAFKHLLVFAFVLLFFQCIVQILLLLYILQIILVQIIVGLLIRTYSLLRLL